MEELLEHYVSMNDLFFKTLLGSKPYWDYKPNAIHVDSPSVNTSDKILILNTIEKTYLKSNVTNGSIVDGLKQPILFNFF